VAKATPFQSHSTPVVKILSGSVLRLRVLQAGLEGEALGGGNLFLDRFAAGRPLAQAPFSQHHVTFAHGTLPGIIAEDRIDGSLQEAPSLHAAQMLVATHGTLYVMFSFNGYPDRFIRGP
jgi:hypothetical protein